MSVAVMDSTNYGDRSRQESFAATKPISMVNNPHRDTSSNPYRESLTGSFLGGGGGSISLSRTPFFGSSWIRER